MTETEASDRILERLDIILELLLPRPAVSEEEKENMLTPARTEVYNLCDAQHSMEDMARELSKTETNIGKMLSELRSANLIRTVQLDGRTVYIRIV